SLMNKIDSKSETSSLRLKTARSLFVILVALLAGFQGHGQKQKRATSMEKQAGLETATLGSGCFWCTEAIFQNVEGVKKVVSGQAAGKVKNPKYEDFCSGLTGHAEVLQLTFDPDVVSFEQLLEIFWQTHDRTHLNKQGADVGTKYRSVVY